MYHYVIMLSLYQNKLDNIIFQFSLIFFSLVHFKARLSWKCDAFLNWYSMNILKLYLPNVLFIIGLGNTHLPRPVHHWIVLWCCHRSCAPVQQWDRRGLCARQGWGLLGSHVVYWYSLVLCGGRSQLLVLAFNFLLLDPCCISFSVFLDARIPSAPSIYRQDSGCRNVT